MIRWIRSLFAWRPVRNTGVWLYEENSITGKRRAIEAAGCYQPLSSDFLRRGDLVVRRDGTSYEIGSDDQIRYG